MQIRGILECFDKEEKDMGEKNNKSFSNKKLKIKITNIWIYKYTKMKIKQEFMFANYGKWAGLLKIQ